MTTIGYRRVSGESCSLRRLRPAHPVRRHPRARRAGRSPRGRDLHRDGGISGTKDTDERPGLEAVVTYCTEHPGTTVLLPKLGPPLLEPSPSKSTSILAVLWAMRQTPPSQLSCDAGENHYLRTGDDPDDPTRTLIRQVLGAVAQFERGQIRLRLRNGRRRKIRDHGWAGGVEPYGWTDELSEQLTISRTPWPCAPPTSHGKRRLCRTQHRRAS